MGLLCIRIVCSLDRTDNPRIIIFKIPYIKYAAVLLQTRCTPVHGPCTDRRASFFLVLWAAARLRIMNGDYYRPSPSPHRKLEVQKPTGSVEKNSPVRKFSTISSHPVARGLTEISSGVAAVLVRVEGPHQNTSLVHLRHSIC